MFSLDRIKLRIVLCFLSLLRNPLATIYLEHKAQRTLSSELILLTSSSI